MSEGEAQVNGFIEKRGVTGITHVLGTDALWGQLGALGTPTWKTISANGETKTGFGAIPSEVINGDWTS